MEMIESWYLVPAFFAGACVMVLLQWERAIDTRRRERLRAARIIREVADREMGGPSVKDQSAQLAAAVFIAAVRYPYDPE